MRPLARRLWSALRRNLVLVSALAIGVVYPYVWQRLHFRPDVAPFLYAPLGLLLAAILLKRLRFDRGTIAIMLGGLVLYFMYTTYTTPGERNYDGPEQLKYITYIYDHFRETQGKMGARMWLHIPTALGEIIPPSKHCFICHHPPLYYVLTAVAYGFFEATKVFPTQPMGVMLFSLLLFFAFLVYGALFARLYSDDVRMVRIATALLVFWPYSIHNSVRVHNDTLASTLVAAGFYYLALWHKQGRARHLYATAICGGLGILTKSAAIALVGCMGLLLAWHFFTRPDRVRLLRRGFAAVAIVGVAYGVGSLRAPVGTDPCHRRFGTACDIRQSDWTTNKPLNYVYFDVPKYLKQPYMIIANDDSGKQYFWNHVVKSSLFGTHNKIPDRETTYPLNRDMGWVMNAALLGMIVYTLLGGLIGIRRGWRRYWVPVLFCVVSAASLMAFKIIIPAPHHTDFRHIYFVMVPGAVLFAAAVEHWRSRARPLGSVGTLLYAPFLVLSVIYFLPKYELVMTYTHATTDLQLATLNKTCNDGAPWDKDGNLIIEGNETVNVHVEQPRTVALIDTSVDGNDTYEIKVFSSSEPARVFYIRPRKVIKVGLARETIKIDPPMNNVTQVSIHPLSGDRVYAMCHMLLN